MTSYNQLGNKESLLCNNHCGKKAPISRGGSFEFYFLCVNIIYMEKANLTKEQREKIIVAMRSSGAVVGYLFGSYARGTAGPLSDIDVAVVFPYSAPLESQENYVEKLRNDMEKIFGADKVDVVNINALKNPLLLYLATLGEGEALFTDDVLLKNHVARRALRDFEDTRYLRHIQSESLKKLFV